MTGVHQRWGVRLAVILIVLAGVTAYWNSFSGPFVLDDLPSIVDNRTIRQLWPVALPLSPPGGTGLTVEGRPLLNLSLALCHAISGTRVWSYHAFNLTVHLLSGLILLGILRRTPRPATADHDGGMTGFAFAVALLWTVHPLQTESVSYVIQRAESLMGLFYLLTLYCFVRGVDGRGSSAWLMASVVACSCGMATKEVMVSAPLVVFFYDRAFISGSSREAWRRRRGYYVGLSATWLLLGWLVAGSGNRGGTSGIGSGIPFIRYWLTQPGAIARYLRLCFWPADQVFDYGTIWVARIPSIIWQALLLAFLAVISLLALWRTPYPGGTLSGTGPKPEGVRASAAPMVGFLGLVFFSILAPTSLVPGNRQTIAEHRMYLALVPVLVATLAGIAFLAGSRSRVLLPLLALLLAVPLSLTTRSRNETYGSVVELYSSDATHMPGNPYAQANLGTALLGEDRYADATSHLTEALRLQPVFPVAEDNLGNGLLHMGRLEEAEEHYRSAIREDPYFADPHSNLGYALLERGKAAEAMVEITAALRLDPNLIEARLNLARALALTGRMPEAFVQYRTILRAAPEDAEARNDYGIALARVGDLQGATFQYREAIRLKSGYWEARYNLAKAFTAAGSASEAIREYREVLRLSPVNPAAHENLGNALLGQDRAAEALVEYEAALGLDPSRAQIHYNLANALLRLNRTPEAIAHYREALRLQPDFEPARRMLGSLGQQP